MDFKRRRTKYRLKMDARQYSAFVPRQSIQNSRS